MACCELVKVNLTIIIIQRITYAFDCTFGCAFDKSNVCGSHANAFAILWSHLNAHSNAQHSNAFAFVNKPVSKMHDHTITHWKNGWACLPCFGLLESLLVFDAILPKQVNWKVFCRLRPLDL